MMNHFNITKVIYFYFIFFLGFLLLWSGCSKQQSSPPPNIFSKEKMAKILPDVHYAEASLQSLTMSERDSMAKIYYAHIFRIHDVKEDDFYASLSYYYNNPSLLQEVYQSTEKKIKEERNVH